MGIIKAEVRDGHLAAYPNEEAWLTPFRVDFDITWAGRWSGFNTEVSVYFLKPSREFQELFGFEHELLLVYSPYPALEPRAIQAAEQALNDPPARGRVERLTYLLVSDANDPAGWVQDYVSRNQETRLIAAFPATELRTRGVDRWYIRNELSKQLFGRDLFNFRLPLVQDAYFFGRQAEELSYRDSIRRGENRGLFGLRKTGKTSLLFKVQRVVRSEQLADVHYIDCQAPEIRTLRWYELIAELTGRLRKEATPAGGSPGKIAKQFTDAVHRATGSGRVLLIFDEIEYISPLARQDLHWGSDFASFWQAIRATQTRYRGLSFILAGVNPNLTEVSTYSGVPNPLFGIVSPQYLTGLNPEETKRMLKTLGKPMGLVFEQPAIDYLYGRYGGHPLLTRIACSLTNTALLKEGKARPAPITRGELLARETVRDSDLSYYCEHVVSELRQFYEDEYAMLELLARKQFADFAQLTRDGMLINHLRDYGLLAEHHGVPRIAIPVIEQHVADQGGGAYLIPGPDRNGWLAQRVNNVIQDLQLLERRIEAKALPSLFGPNSFRDADRLARVQVVQSKDGFEAFINVLYQCLVESVERYGKDAGKTSYFWDLKNSYPALIDALERVKVYRHMLMHTVLQPDVEEKRQRFLDEDLGERQSTIDAEAWFALQQRVLDRLFNAIQVETSKLT